MDFILTGDGKLYVAPNRDKLTLVDGVAYSYDGNTPGYERLIRWTGTAWEGIVDVSGTPGVDTYLDYKVHFNIDGTTYLARIAPPWVPAGGNTGGNYGNVQTTTLEGAAAGDIDGSENWKNSDGCNWVIAPDGSAYVYGKFIKARWRAVAAIDGNPAPYTILDAKCLTVWKDGRLQAYKSLP